MAFTTMFDNSKLRKADGRSLGNGRVCALATDTRGFGTPHELRNGGPQAVPNSGARVHESIAKGVEREWWNVAGSCMFQMFE
jgi:hypothetical protein